MKDDLSRLARCAIEQRCRKITGHITSSYELALKYGCPAGDKPGKVVDVIGGALFHAKIWKPSIGILHSQLMALSIHKHV